MPKTAKKKEEKRGGKRAGAGRKPWQPTQTEMKLIETAAIAGYTLKEIEVLLGKSIETIQKHCSEELERGRLDADLKVINSLFTEATVEKNVTAMIFWLKARRKWSDRVEVETKIEDARETIDRPKNETREEWLQRQASKGTS